MSYKVFLFNNDHFSEGPDWWDNFYYAHNDWAVGGFNADALLSAWNAKIITTLPQYPWGDQTIVFETEADYTAFLLRWN
jgi:hypothetical protein